jgi:Arabinose efflux permease
VKQERRREPNPLKPLVLPVFLPAVVYATGQGALAPVMVLAALSIGFDHAGSSAVLGIFGLIGVLASPFLGRLITRIGDRKALTSAGAVTALSLLVSLLSMAIGGTYTAFAKIAFVVSLVFVALGGAIWQLGRQAYVAESVGNQWRARGMSTLGGMSRIGQLIGPALSTVLVTIWFLGSAFWLAFAMTVISTIMVLVFLVPLSGRGGKTEQKPTQKGSPASESKPTAVPEPAVVPQSDKRPEPVVRSWFATMVMGIGLNTLGVLRANRNVIVPLWGTFIGVDESVITATFAISALVDSVMFLVTGGMMDRFGRMAAIVPSLTIMPAGIVIMLVWPNLPGFIVGASVLGFGNGFGAGIVMTTGVDLSPSYRRADFLGLWQAIVNTGNAAGPFIASAMTASLGVAASLWATAGIGVVGVVWLAALIKPAYARLGVDTRGRPLKNE